MLQTSKSDRRCRPQVLQRWIARNFRHPLRHPAAHLESRPTGDTGESLQDEDERGRMIVGQQHVFDPALAPEKGVEPRWRDVVKW